MPSDTDSDAERNFFIDGQGNAHQIHLPPLAHQHLDQSEDDMDLILSKAIGCESPRKRRVPHHGTPDIECSYSNKDDNHICPQAFYATSVCSKSESNKLTPAALSLFPTCPASLTENSATPELKPDRRRSPNLSNDCVMTIRSFFEAGMINSTKETLQMRQNACVLTGMTMIKLDVCFPPDVSILIYTLLIALALLTSIRRKFGT